MRASIQWLLVAALSGGPAAAWQARSASSQCASGELSQSRKQQLAQYVTDKYKLQDYATVKIVRERIDPRTCYRELTFQGASAVKTWELTMFLSPDQRFLTSELFDTTLDPREQERRQNEALMTDPAQNKAAVRGPDNAPVTVVEFADFECPFCRNLASMMEQVLPSGKVRVIFHHMPISSHAWARAGAVGAACAQLQSAAAFWAMHDQIFQHQHEITPKNVSQELIDFARMSKQVDMQAFQNCVAAQASLGLVLRDMDLAAAYDVNATPTLFINGHRVSGVKDAHELTELIDEAEAENRSALTQPRR